jgi:uncharacterized protein YdhG (YjbR/CyaY superfamily)
MPTKTHDEFLESVKPDQRDVLQKLRKQIKAAAPDAEEAFSYGLPAFRVNDRPLVAYGATAKHCAFFPMNPEVQAAHSAKLNAFDTSKGTIRFQPEKPIPAAVVRSIVKARLKELKGASTGNSRTDPKVDTLLAKLRHPLKREVGLLRKDILASSAKVVEEFKWNSPSFKLADHFATIHVRGSRLLLVLHTGAKRKAGAGPTIADSAGLLQWRGKDRALVEFADAADFKAKRAAVKKILAQWVRQV